MTREKEYEVIAYHFVGDTLRDGRDVPADGEKLVHDDLVELCCCGLHASLCPFDALQYAPGPVLCRVRCGGDIVSGDDKIVCTERTIMARIDATDLLRRFNRLCALDVIHLWDAPDVVREYLETGDENRQTAARSAAVSAIADAYASEATILDAALAVGRITGFDPDAATAAGTSAARAAGRDAVIVAARTAAWEAVIAAHGAATRGVDWVAVRENQRQRFRQMVEDEFAETAK